MRKDILISLFNKYGSGYKPLQDYLLSEEIALLKDDDEIRLGDFISFVKQSSPATSKESFLDEMKKRKDSLSELFAKFEQAEKMPKDNFYPGSFESTPSEVVDAEIIKNLTDKDARSLSRTSTEFHERGKKWDIWKRKMIEAGCDKTVLDELAKQPITVDYKKLCEAFMRMPGDKKSTQLWQLLCLCGDPKAISLALRLEGVTKTTSSLDGYNMLDYAIVSRGSSAIEYAIKCNIDRSAKTNELILASLPGLGSPFYDTKLMRSYIYMFLRSAGKLRPELLTQVLMDIAPRMNNKTMFNIADEALRENEIRLTNTIVTIWADDSGRGLAILAINDLQGASRPSPSRPTLALAVKTTLALDVNLIDAQGNTLLMHMLRYLSFLGDPLNLVQRYLDRCIQNKLPIDLTIRNKKGESAFILACNSHSLWDVALKMLEMEPRLVNSTDEKGEPAYIVTLRKNNIKLTSILLLHPDAQLASLKQFGYEAMLLAIERREIGLLKLIYEKSRSMELDKPHGDIAPASQEKLKYALKIMQYLSDLEKREREFSPTFFGFELPITLPVDVGISKEKKLEAAQRLLVSVVDESNIAGGIRPEDVPVIADGRLKDIAAELPLEFRNRFEL